MVSVLEGDVFAKLREMALGLNVEEFTGARDNMLGDDGRVNGGDGVGELNGDKP